MLGISVLSISTGLTNVNSNILSIFQFIYYVFIFLCKRQNRVIEKTNIVLQIKFIRVFCTIQKLNILESLEIYKDHDDSKRISLPYSQW